MGRTVPTTSVQTRGYRGETASPSTSLVLAHCAIDDRRTVLEILCEETECALGDLAERVAAARTDVDPGAVPDGARRNTMISLYHNHLQKLDGASIVDLDESGPTATVTLAPTLDTDRVRELVVAGDGHWDVLGVILGDPRRERVVSLLASATGDSLPLEHLARAIAALERAEGGSPPEAAVESVRVSLHHVHLPKLDTSGLVEYDAVGGTVELREIPDAYEDVIAGSAEDVAA